MTTNPKVSVTRDDAAERYVITVDDAAPLTAVAGFAAFQASDTHVAFTHTELHDAYQGQGLGSQLAAYALADAVARDLTIIPLCAYMARYLERHEVEGARIEWPNRAQRT